MKFLNEDGLRKLFNLIKTLLGVKYQKPPNGIPLSDLAQSVQTAITGKSVRLYSARIGTTPYFIYEGIWDGQGYMLISFGRFNTTMNPATQFELYLVTAHGGMGMTKSNFIKIAGTSGSNILGESTLFIDADSVNAYRFRIRNNSNNDIYITVTAIGDVTIQ